MRKRKSRQRKSEHREPEGKLFAHSIDRGRYLQLVKKGAPLHKKQDPGRNLRASPAGRSVYGRHQCSERTRRKKRPLFQRRSLRRRTRWLGGRHLVIQSGSAVRCCGVGDRLRQPRRGSARLTWYLYQECYDIEPAVLSGRSGVSVGRALHRVPWKPAQLLDLGFVFRLPLLH